MDLNALRSELTLDPLVRGYAAMDDVAAAKSLTTVRDRQMDNETITGGEILACVDKADWLLLPADLKQYLCGAFAAASIPNTANLRNFLKDTFTQNSSSDNKLTALLRRTGSRAEELGLGRVTESDVADARRLP